MESDSEGKTDSEEVGQKEENFNPGGIPFKSVVVYSTKNSLSSSNTRVYVDEGVERVSVMVLERKDLFSFHRLLSSFF